LEQNILRKVQLTQLEIAKEIRRVCEENDISYFLADGTMLGAVRHNGFIPWDDDMDIGMLRAEYEKFCRIAPEKLGKDYVLQTWYIDPNYCLPFAKVRKRNTLYVEGKSSQLKENGFFVDIFPFDYVPEEAEKRIPLAQKQIQIFRMRLMKCRYTPWREADKINWKKRLGYLYYQLRAVFADQMKLAQEFDALATQTPKTNAVWEHNGGAVPICYPESLFTELVPYTFENEAFMGVKEYDTYLRTTYGDYMQLPPEDQRGNQHVITQLDFGE